MSDQPSILKTVSAYDFFPGEETNNASVPIPGTEAAADPAEDDYDDPDGALFSGPVAESVPTSTSAFRMRAKSRRQDLCRMSRELSRSRGDEEDGRMSVGGRSRRSNRSKRRSRSRRGSEASATTFQTETDAASAVSMGAGVSAVSDSELGSDEDPYGPYGSSESDNTTDSNSSTEARRGWRPSFLPGGMDPFFGESRIDFESMDEDEDTSHIWGANKVFSLKANQAVYIPDEDLSLRFKGIKVSAFRNFVWGVGCTVSLGTLWLVGRWMPTLWLNNVCREGDFSEASFVVVECPHYPPVTIPLKTIHFDNPILIGNIFPPSVVKPPAHRDDVVHPSSVSPDAVDVLELRIESPALTLGNGHAVGAGTPKKYKGVTMDEVKYLDYRYYRFLLHPEGEFRMVREWKDPIWKSLSSLRRGLSDVDATFREKLIGKNEIKVASPGTVTLLMDEVLHPFYVFQLASIALWSFDNYYYYAFAIAVISIGSIVVTLIETRKNIERMRDMSLFACPVNVLRNGKWTTIDSSDLLPGDVVDLAEDSLHTFPADFVMLSGDAIVNESMLTGESVPVSKFPVDEATVPDISKPGGNISADLSRHVVFNGTKIVRVRKMNPPASFGINTPEALGMVIRTGFDTTKGALVRSILFPKPFGFAFYRDSFRFIGVLGLVACFGFIISSINFIHLGISWHVIVIRALDLVTIVVPPALPATMSIGTSFAISRLRKSNIFCISPTRINIGGKVNIVCFDKTGTLTEEGLDVLGVRSVVRSTNRFTDLIEDADSVPIFGTEDAKTPLLHALAACHALKLVRGEILGDPLDIRMFEFTGWTLEEGKEISRPSVGKPKKPTTSKVIDRAPTLVQTILRPPGGEAFRIEDALKAGRKHAHFLELGVIRSFDFVSSLRRMSVMVKKLKSTSIEIYVKGAPEVMSEICNPNTLPFDYEETLEYYTKHGYRVIALAAKSMPNLTWVKAQRMKRDAAESNLRFIGLIIFENKIKPGTAPAISTLKYAQIPTRMVTGDNVRTAISVGRECGMISHTARVYLPSFLKGSLSTPRSVIAWTDVDDDSNRLDSYSLLPQEQEDRSFNSEYSGKELEYHLAVTGDVFRWMMDYGALETLQRMLIKGVIFARMSPDEKHELVERLQSIGYTVGFCGDGANDCGALKAADVGLSLSEAEASVAAPFTSKQPDIGCFLEVIKEGRAALVTSFSCFKFMALYSLIQFTTVTLLYYIASSLGDFQFLYIDLFLILPIAVTLGRTEAYNKIVPKRPTASLMSKKVLTSLVGQIFLTTSFQMFIFFFVRMQTWYEAPTIDPDELDIVSYENTSLFLLSSFQYIMIAAVFCVGPPYRKPMYTNFWLMVAFTVLGIFSCYTLFSASGPIFDLLQLINLPREFHLELLLIIIANIFLSFAFEGYAVETVTGIVGDLAKRFRRARGKRREDGKIYKSIQRSMED